MAYARGRTLGSFGQLFGEGQVDSSYQPVATDVSQVDQYVWEVARNLDTVATVVVTDPTGGGTLAAGVDPTQGASLCRAMDVVRYLEIQPAGSSTVYRYSDDAINKGNPKQPRVLKFGSFTRSFSNDIAEFQGTTITSILIDTDKFLRDADETDALINARITYYMTTITAILASATPVRIFDGVIVDTRQVGPRLFEITANDYFATLLREFSSNTTFPRRLFTLTDFPNMGNSDDLANPGNLKMLGKPVPWCYGLLTDESLGAAAQGMVPAIFVGRRVINGFNWDEYVVAAHACAGGILSVFGYLFGTRQKYNPGMYGVDVILPGNEPTWSAHVGTTQTYVDYPGGRFTRFFARGPYSDAAIQGSFPFTVNIGGVTENPNGTGAVITGFHRQIAHLFNNVIFGAYTNEASWLAPPAVPGTLYSRIDQQSFEDAATESALYVAGGFKGAFIVGGVEEASSFLQILQRAGTTGAFDIGIDMHGRLFVSMISPTKALNRSISYTVDVLQTDAEDGTSTFKSDRRRDELKTVVRYAYGKRYVEPITKATPEDGFQLPADAALLETGKYIGENIQLTAPAGLITKYGERIYDMVIDMTTDPLTAAAVAGIKLAVLGEGRPNYIEFEEGTCGTDTEMGDRDEVTHDELPTAVEVDHSIRCEQHSIDIDTLRVRKMYRDLQHIDLSGLEI